MTYIESYTVTFSIILGFVTLLWLVSLVLKNSSIVDIFWGTGFVIASWIYFAMSPDGFIVRKLLICLLVTIWGFRLSIHILLRNWGKPEDFRYQRWRNESGESWWWRSWIRVFLLQGVLLWIISAPLLVAQRSALPDRLIFLDYLGAVIWLVGFFFETMGDLQLANFKSDPKNKGQVMKSGVWKYSRHPNYFGNSTQWWGYYLIAAAAGGWWTIFSPILMTFFLVRVSGVALLEKTMKSRPMYNEYIQRTSAFIPWFPRKK